VSKDDEVTVFAAAAEEPGLTHHQLAERTGLPVSTTCAALAVLYRRRYVDGQILTGDDTVVDAQAVMPTPSGRTWYDGQLARASEAPTVAAVADVWRSRSEPILRAVAEREGFGTLVTVEELADATGLTHEQVDTELIRLLDADYIDASDYSKTAAAGRRGHWKLVSPVVMERGARTIGMWPTIDPYELLVQLLERRIGEEPNEERKGKLRRLRDDLGDIGKGTVSGVLVELMKLGTGMA